MEQESIKNMVAQAEKDGQKNLIDIIKYTGKPVSELKSLFGKGRWKMLCSNSRAKNQSILRLSANSKTHLYDLPSGISALKTKTINNVCGNFERLVSQGLSGDFEILDIIFMDEFINESSNYEGYFRFENKICYIRDVKSMAQDLGEKFSFKWSWKRMVKEHDRLSKLGRIKKFGSDIDEVFDLNNEVTSEIYRSIRALGKDSRNVFARNLVYEDGFFFVPNNVICTSYSYLYSDKYGSAMPPLSLIHI